MKALTIQQPYASMIADRKKWVENRNWNTTYRGPLAIHAGSGTRYLNAEVLASYPTGAVIAMANLVACIHLGPRRPTIVTPFHRRVLVRLGISVEDFLAHEHTEGPFCLILKDVRKLPVPIPAVGKQGLWEWVVPEELFMCPECGHVDDINGFGIIGSDDDAKWFCDQCHYHGVMDEVANA